MSPFNLVFAGTPEFSAHCLTVLIEANFTISAVYTQPDRAAGRGNKLQPSPVKMTALEHHLPVFQPVNFRNPDDVAALAALKPDLMVVVAYGLLLPQSVLDIPKYGCINVHASLLPHWRGAAPIERAIEAGDPTTGITIMQMDAGLDTGDILNRREIAINTDTTGDSLRQLLATLGSEALVETIRAIQHHNLHAEPQDHGAATYAHKLRKEEAAIDWQRPALEIDRKIRAFTSSNVCHTHLDSERIKVWQGRPVESSSHQPPGTIIEVSRKAITVACGTGAMALSQLQLAGAKKMDVAAILNGRQDLFAVGKRLV